MSHYLIDGYNLINLSDVLESCGHDMSLSRDVLFSKLKTFLNSQKGSVATIVYDSKIGVLNVHNTERDSRIHVIFASASEIADFKIQKILASEPDEGKRQNYTVASSDSDIRRESMFKFSKTMTSEDFAELAGI